MHLKRQGWSRQDIAEALGVSARASAVGLLVPATAAPKLWRARSGPGRPPKLSPTQKRLIPEFLWHGAGGVRLPGRGLDLRPQSPG